jgi:hypothetical protein
MHLARSGSKFSVALLVVLVVALVIPPIASLAQDPVPTDTPTPTDPVNNLSHGFPPGPGAAIIQNPDDDMVNDTTSTQQNLNCAAGLLVLANDSSTKRYLHNYLSLGQVSLLGSDLADHRPHAAVGFPGGRTLLERHRLHRKRPLLPTARSNSPAITHVRWRPHSDGTDRARNSIRPEGGDCRYHGKPSVTGGAWRVRSEILRC